MRLMETRGAKRDPHPERAVRSRISSAALAPGRESSSDGVLPTTAVPTTAVPTTAAHLDAMSLSDFSHVARVLSVLCREVGLTVPGFRSPPRSATVDRAIIRRSDGGAAIAVRLQGRSRDAVIDDLIDGVCVVNGLDGRARAGWVLALGLLVRQRCEPTSSAPTGVTPRSRSSHRRVSATTFSQPPSAA
jgi:hypothetical protein